MTFDGMTGQSMTYNDLDLIGNIVRNDTTLVNYSYLSDGTKLSALDGSGAGLVYRGPFVYRKSSGGNAGSSLTLESAAFGGGLMTPSGAMFYVTDYLGSVRAVVDGKTGDLYKASDYSAFGDESVVMVRPQENTPPQPLAAAVLPAGLTLRDGYTGKEAQNKDFGTSYIDFGARQYSPALRRWMTPDPLSEKYYGVSPYAFCNNNPVNFVDPDGEDPSLIWDIASIGLGIDSFRDNYRAGKYGAAIFDGFGIAIDVVAAFIPVIPGGVGILRTGNRVLNIADAGIDALKLGDELSSFSHAAEFGVDSYKNLKKSVQATYGTGSGLEVHHLIEKRFAKQMGMKEADMPSIVLTKDEHKQFTAAWREAIGYDKSGAEMFTSGVGKEQILNVARDIYKDYPELLKTIEEIFK